jgi:hypothetical protein
MIMDSQCKQILLLEMKLRPSTGTILCKEETQSFINVLSNVTLLRLIILHIVPSWNEGQVE